MEVAKRKSQRIRSVKLSVMIQPDEIIRSKRKTLSVCIDPLGKITVRAPMSCTKERIFAFLQEKENWILKQTSKTAGACMRLPSENLHGFSFLLLGRECTIYLYAGNRIQFDQENYALWLPTENARERLVKWLKANAKRLFSQLTKNAAERMQTSYVSVSVTSAKTRWGSCSFSNAIRYSFRLIYAPKEVIEYVVVHELSHTRFKNHSPLFWREVEKYCPDYKKKRAWLKNNGILMRIF